MVLVAGSLTAPHVRLLENPSGGKAWHVDYNYPSFLFGSVQQTDILLNNMGASVAFLRPRQSSPDMFHPRDAGFFEGHEMRLGLR